LLQTDKSVHLDRYCCTSPSTFSLDPSSKKLWGSQKHTPIPPTCSTLYASPSPGLSNTLRWAQRQGNALEIIREAKKTTQRSLPPPKTFLLTLTFSAFTPGSSKVTR
jgi:hypothetical protein